MKPPVGWRFEAYLVLWKDHLRVLWGGGVQVGVVIFLELSITHLHGLFELLVVNSRCDILGCLNCFHQRGTHNLVLADGDDGRRRLG